MKSIYRQFTDRIAATASQASGVGPGDRTFNWLAGLWLWQGETVEFGIAPYGISARLDERDEPYLIYNAPSGMWLMVLIDPAAFGILIGQPMHDGQTRFTGDVTIRGKSVQLRQFWNLLEDASIEVRTERRGNGRWTVWSCDTLERQKTKREAAQTERQPNRKTRRPMPSEFR